MIAAGKKMEYPMKLWPFPVGDPGGPELDRDPDDRDQDPPQDRHDVFPMFVIERCRWSGPSTSLHWPFSSRFIAAPISSRAHRASSAQVPPTGYRPHLATPDCQAKCRQLPCYAMRSHRRITAQRVRHSAAPRAHMCRLPAASDHLSGFSATSTLTGNTHAHQQPQTRRMRRTPGCWRGSPARQRRPQAVHRRSRLLDGP
jgi:hypothetical protein